MMNNAIATETKEMPVIHLKAAESSKQIKKHLKQIFNHPFSVTLKNFSLRVRWTDGPSINEVEKVLRTFEGAEMVQNGADMIKGHKDYVEFNGQRFDFGIDFIFTERNYSDEIEKTVETFIVCHYGEHLPVSSKDRYEFRIRKELNASDILRLVSIESL